MIQVPVEENKKKILELLTSVKREGMDKLLEWIDDSDFFTSIASTKYHSNILGGLAHHSLKVYELLKDKVIKFGYDKVYDSNNVILVGLLHDLCKANTYVQEMRNKKFGPRDWREVPYWTVDDTRFPFGHGEKSVAIILNFIKLTKEEMLSIRWHMGGFDESITSYTQSKAFHKAVEIIPLAVLIATADFESTYLLEEIEKENIY